MAKNGLFREPLSGGFLPLLSRSFRPKRSEVEGSAHYQNAVQTACAKILRLRICDAPLRMMPTVEGCTLYRCCHCERRRCVAICFSRLSPSVKNQRFLPPPSQREALGWGRGHRPPFFCRDVKAENCLLPFICDSFCKYGRFVLHRMGKNPFFSSSQT